MGDIIFDGARHTVAQANIDARRLTTTSGNKKRAAEASLGQFEQSVSNNRVLEAGGRQSNSIEENLQRNLDAAATGKLSQRIAAAEELGATATEAAAAGVGGSSIESYNATLRLRDAIAEEQGDRTVNTQVIAAGDARADTLSNSVSNMDTSSINANLDFSQFVDDHKMGALTKITALGATAAATYFGGPSAGTAVMNVFSANQRAQNGDLAGASKAMGAAIDNGINGFKTYRAGADDEHSGQAWGKKAFSGVNFKL